MIYKKFDNHLVVRLDPKDQIIATLLKVVKAENITLATVVGIGAVESFIVGFFNPLTKQYQEKEFKGYYEITSLLGNITSKDGEPYFHLHATFGDDQYQVIGGHLKEATISVTGEIIIQVMKGSITRQMNPIGINLMEF